MAPRQDDEWILTINVILYQSIWDKCLNYFLLSPDESIEMFIFSLRRSAATSHCSVVHTETSENRFFAMPRDTRKRLYITRRSISCLLAGRFRLSADFSLVSSDRKGARLVQSGHECFGDDFDILIHFGMHKFFFCHGSCHVCTVFFSFLYFWFCTLLFFEGHVMPKHYMPLPRMCLIKKSWLMAENLFNICICLLVKSSPDFNV